MHVNWIVDSALAPIPRADPDEVVLSFETDQSWTRRELCERRDQLARLLSELGIGAGDRVGLLLHNCLDYYALYFACGLLGAVSVRINFRLAAPEVAFAVRDSGCRALIFHEALGESLAEARSVPAPPAFVCLDSDRIPWAPLLDGLPAADDLPASEVQGTDPVTLMYTSGTTGRPKGALWSHENTLWFAASEAIGFQMRPDSVTLVPGPAYHIASLECHLLPTLVAGGRGVFLRSGGFSVDRLLEICERERVTDLLVFPEMLYEVLRRPKEELADRLASVRAISCGGDTVQPWIIDTLDEVFPGVRFDQGYGLTEGGGVGIMLESRYRRSHRVAVGRPLPFVEVKVVDEAGEELPPEVPGEVMLRSPATSSGYFRRPEANKATFVDGWCRTGDQGHYSEDGFLYLTGRIKDMIRSGGENIFPAQIEAVLTDHADIDDAAVVGVPDAKFLEAGCAVIVLRPGARVTDEELLEHCRMHLARFKCPKYFVRVDALPRTASGKVMKHVLRDEYRNLGETVTSA